MSLLSSLRPVVTLWLVVAACHEPPPLFPPNAPDDIRQACALTQRKCTACHDRDRIIDARHGVTEWRTTVERMRKIPGSAISPTDAETVLRCLTYSVDPSTPPR